MSAEKVGSLNTYVCDTCRIWIVTTVVDEGVTPFMIPHASCQPTPCKGSMQSTFGRLPMKCPPPDFEWYRPLRDWVVRDGKRWGGDVGIRDNLQHYEKGGLWLRRVTSAREKVDPHHARMRATTPATTRKTPRNSPCWCGSGVKSKRCQHGHSAEKEISQ